MKKSSDATRFLAALLVISAGAALTLTGCGGSSEKTSDDQPE